MRKTLLFGACLAAFLTPGPSLGQQTFDGLDDVPDSYLLFLPSSSLAFEEYWRGFIDVPTRTELAGVAILDADPLTMMRDFDRLRRFSPLGRPHRKINLLELYETDPLAFARLFAGSGDLPRLTYHRPAVLPNFAPSAEVPVPEPGALALLALGLLLVAGRGVRAA